jgi:integrase
MAINFTAKLVAQLLKKPGRYRDSLVRGLLLVVVSEKAASWQLRFELGGKERWMGLGSAREFTLKEARERALAARQRLADKVDPLAERKAARTAAALAAAKVISFEEAATAYFDQHERKWKNGRHRAQFLSSLRLHAFPVIGKLPVSAIDTSLVLKVIEPIWPTTTETANRVRNRIETILDWATVRGHRSGDNPARWRGHISEVLPARAALRKTNHHPALPFNDLPAFLVALRGRAGIAARALEFLILTAARTGEVVGARWEEIDFGTATWTIPAGRMKGGREHRVPLAPRAVELLKSMFVEEGNPFVFIGSPGRGLSSVALAQVLQRMGLGKAITVHGFRSTFSDWAHEQTAFANHVIELSLAHTVGSGVERAYRRGDLLDKRRKLLEAWSEYCSAPKAAGEVIALRKAGAS